MNSPESRNPEGVISGSFKFKPEIDAAINEFRDLNIIIRAPGIGWLYAPAHGLITVTNNERFQPLPTETHMIAGEAEAAFLHQLDTSDFVYLMNPEGYLGDMTIIEVGYTHGIKKRMYASNPLDFHALHIHDPKMIDLLHNSVAIMSPTDAARDMRRKLALANASTLVTSTFAVMSNGSEQVNHRRPGLSVALSHVAEGAIMRCSNKMLLVEDGRWGYERLTIAGTQVRAGERRVAALERLMENKMGVSVADVTHFATSFMLPESGYKRPVNADTFVFDDHIVDLTSQRVQPQRGIVPTWVSYAEAEALIDTGQVEPNAAKLITDYMQTAI